MKYLRRQNFNQSSVLDATFLKRADGNIELNPTHRVIVNGEMEFGPGASIPSVEVSNVMYVTMDGDDKNTGKGEGPSQAKRTIKSAVESAQEGTTIYVRSGEYYEDNPIRLPPKVSIVGDNLRRTIIRPINNPIEFDIVFMERTDGVVTITTAVPHGFLLHDRVRVTCTNSEVDDECANIIEIPSSMTFKYKDLGEDIALVPVGGTVEKGFDMFKVNSQSYIAQVVFKGLRAPSYCLDIDKDAIVDTSPYIQNCSNINGPWMRNGEEWIPFVTQQPDLTGTFITGPRPLKDDEIDPTQVDQYGIKTNGAGGGMLIDGDRYNSESPIKSMVADAFTQVAQGAVGFHITNFGYMQLVSCFSVFCDKAFLTTKGGYLSISNSVVDFGNQGFVADGYYPTPYASGVVNQDYYSTVASALVLNPGEGYLTAPDVVIEPPDTPGGVTAVAVASLDESRGIINAITVLNSGSGYTREPSLTLVGGDPTTPASGRVNLATNIKIKIKEIGDKPQVASVMFLGDDPQGYYITSTENSTQAFKYNEQKCRRDVGLILDAVMSDVVFGTNHKSVYAGLAYLRSYSAKVLSLQKAPTIDGVIQARDLALARTTDPVALQRINDNFGIVINILNNGLAGSSQVSLTNPVGRDAGFVEAREILLANRSFIKDELVAWIAENAEGFDYDETKCSRDVGLIVEAVLADMVLGSTHLSTYAGISYLRSYSSTVIRSQRKQTVDGINRARDIILGLLPDTSYETEQIIRRNFGIITQIINDVNINNVPSAIYTNTAIISDEKASSVAQIKANKEFLTEEVVSYIRDSLNIDTIPNYDELVCKRDTRYIIDALTFDLLYGGNSASVAAAQAYYIGNSSTVQGEESAFNAAFARLQDAIESVIQGLPWTPSPSNTKTQNLSNPAGDQINADIVIDLIDSILNIVNNGTNAVGVIVYPDYSNGAYYAFKEDDRDFILTNLEDIKLGVIEYLNTVYKGNFVYNEETCRRDVDYILDAIAYDLTYGGNSATTVAGLAYGDGNVILGQVEETLNAYKHWRNILLDILQNVPIVPSTGNVTQQVTNLPIGSPTPIYRPATIAQDLLQIIIDVVDYGSGYVPEPSSSPLFDLAPNDLVQIRSDILADSEIIQNDVIEYLNITYGGEIEVIVYPGIIKVEENTIAKFHNPSTISTASTALEYVGSGVTYNALPFFGGEPDPTKERIEIDQGRCFTVTSDQVGNYRVGEIFRVNALTGGVTIDAGDLDLRGLSGIGPFKRNNGLVGEQLREVSNNPNLIASTGVQDVSTVPTQQAVAFYVEDRYLNKVQGTTPQTVQSEVIFESDLGINGGDLVTTNTEFNLLNDTAETINFAGAATAINIGTSTGTTTINHDLVVNGSSTLGDDKELDLVSLNGGVLIDLPDNDFDSLTIQNGLIRFITVDTLTGTEQVSFGETPLVLIENVTDSIDKDTGALVVEGGVGIEKNLTVGLDITINGTEIFTTSTEFSLLDTVAETINFAGEATLIDIGASTGVTNVKHNLNIDGNELTTTSTSFELLEGIAETIIFAHAASDLSMASTTGTTSIRNNLDVGIDVNVVGENITTSSTTFNLLDTIATTVNFAGEASELNLSSNTGNTNVLNSLNVDINSRLGLDTDSINTVNGILTVNIKDNTSDVFEIKEAGNIYIRVNSDDSLEKIIFGTLPTYSFENTTDADSTISASTTFAGGVGIAKKLFVGSDFNVANNTILGSDKETHSHSLIGSLDVNLPENVASALEIKENVASYITIDTTNDLELITIGTLPKVLISNITESTDKDTGALVVEGGVGIEKNLNVGGNIEITGDAAIEGGNLTTTQASFNLLNDNAITVNAFGAATDIQIGSATGTLTVNNLQVVFNSVDSIQIPVGDTSERDQTPAPGQIRYNNELSTFEGYGPGDAWGSLGGVRDVNGDTYIQPETAPGANEDTLYFYNNNVLTLTIEESLFSLKEGVDAVINSNASSTSKTTGALVVVGGVGISETINANELILTNDLTVEHGGTGVSTLTEKGILYGNGTGVVQVTAASDPGNTNAITSYGVLTTDINNVPVWTDVIDGGSY